MIIEKTKSKGRGILYIILAAFFFSLLTVCVRLSGDLPTMEKVLFRNLVASVAAWILLIRSGEKLNINRKNLPDLVLRSICGTIGMVCNFYAIDRMNISDANMLNKMSPFFAVILSIFILKEKPRRWEILTVIIAFLGSLLVIKPGFNLECIPAVIGLLGGLGAGMAYTFVRKLGISGVRGPVIVMFFSTSSTLFSLPFFIMSYQPMSMWQFCCLFMGGIAATGGQLSITAAYTYAPAKEISVFDYTQIIFAALWGFLIFEQIPDWLSFVGYAVIISAALVRFIRR